MNAKILRFLGYIAEFLCIYLPLHLFGFYGNGAYEEIPMMLVGLVFGIVAAIVSARLRKKETFSGIVVFCGIFLFTLTVSTILFFSHVDENTFMWNVFYYFPQMLFLVFMIPGVAANVVLKIFFVKKPHTSTSVAFDNRVEL